MTRPTLYFRSAWRLGLALLAVIVVLAAWAAWDLTRISPARSLSLPAELPEDALARGELQFAHGDLGVIDLDTLETSALPWTVLSAALALDATKGDVAKVSTEVVEQAFRGFGFLYPADSENPPGLPLGLTLARIERTMPPLRISAVNLGCAACHAGVRYRPDGMPDPLHSVLGQPNTSLDLEAYTQTVFRALKSGFADEDGLWLAIDRLYPDLSWRERLSLRWLVLPKAKARIAELEKTGGMPLPFSNGAPGLTNGVAALKLRLGLIPEGAVLNDAGFVSVPDLADRGFRSAFLADGAYSEPGKTRFAPRSADDAAKADPAVLARIGSFFTVPSMGMSPERAERAIPAFTDIVRFLAQHRAERFPGAIDGAKLAAGQAVYARACAECHGSYDGDLERPGLTSFPNWAGDVGTDMSRATAFDAALAERVNGRTYRRYISAEATGKLAAPLLTGLWASAPYFVNGSVPTLRDVLEPEERPERFMVGGHRLDLTRVGLALAPSADGVWRDPTGYKPFSTPAEIDTRKHGFSNKGHERQVEGISPDERDALIEYLKLL